MMLPIISAKSIGKNIRKKQNGKYSQKLLGYAKNLPQMYLKLLENS